MKIQVRRPDFRKVLRATGASRQRNVRRAAVIATDRASREARDALRVKMQSMGLGRLGNAVGQTSSKRHAGSGAPYGVIYARGGDNSLAGGALEAYGQGVTIRAQQRQWLAFQTGALPRRINRFRTTPERYMASSLVQSIGKLEFRPIGPDRALLVVKRVSLSPKTGRAKALGPGKTRTRIPVKEAVAFVLIRRTNRMKRYDKNITVLAKARLVPQYMVEELRRMDAAA